jgi:zinc protease
MPGDFSRQVAREGGQENAFTSLDYTGYFQNVAADRLELVMRLEADRMANLVLTDEVVLPERDVILEERRSRVENSPASLLREHAMAALFLNHPYRIPIIGWMHEMERLTAKDAVEFYDRYYAPNNAVLIVTGDATVARVRELAEKYYGPIPPKAIPARVRPSEPPHRAPRRVQLASSEVANPSLTRYYLAPGYGGAGREHAYALQVLSEILGSGPTSRLYRALVEGQSLASSAGSFYDPASLGPGTFGLYASPRQGQTVADAEAALDRQIGILLADGVGEAEVERAKNRMVTSAIFARDSLRGPAQTLGAALAAGRTIADVEEWPDRIGRVTREQVEAAARAVFKIENSVTSLLLPKPTS